jgi:PKD repeat protein
MPSGCVGDPYNEVVQFVFPIDTTISGFTVPFDSFQITAVTSLPTGLSYVCDNVTCKFIPSGPGQPARGCVVVSGIPTMAFGPNNQVGVDFTGWATVFATVQSINSTIDIELDVNASSTAAFTSSVSVATATFTNTSTGAGAYSWDFGDGNSSTQTSPVHTYAGPGNYVVCLIATNGTCPDTTCQQVTAGCPAPTAAFTNTANSLAVSFTDGTLGAPTSWFWDFGDGNTATTQNPTHTYALPGTYQVCLTATDPCGTDSSCSSITVTCPAPAVAFTSSANLLVVDFTDGSSSSGGNISYFWDFGDGNTSTTQSPSHTYAAAGNYLVCFTVSDDCGADSSCQNTNVISIGMPEPSLFGQLRAFPNPNAGIFTLQGNLLADLPLEVRVADLVGKVVYESELSAGFGEFSQRIALDQAVPGLYFVQVRAGEEVHTLKIRVE